MHYIYHGVPEPMIGSVLKPLNTMQDAMRDIKEQHLSKYEGREKILERKVTVLDCAWNDVLQFLPFHPIKAFQLQVDLELIPEMPHYKFYKIPLDALDPSLTAIFFKSAPGEENSSFKMLADVNFDDIQEMPEPTVRYYKSLVGTGELPFNYQFVPHVLYKNQLDISNFEIITL